MNAKSIAAALCFFSFTFFPVLGATAPEVDPEKDLPRHPHVEPARAIETIHVKKGFRVELAASEPLIMDPIDMCFDENGRLFVVEMRDYSERRDERLGRIRLLEDTNGDGRFDKSHLFADDLPWPTAVFCWNGGVFVGSTPDIFYLKDTDSDNKADVRRRIYTGFGNTRDRLNVQALMNSFNWGLDNRIHGLTAPNGGIVTNLALLSEKPVDLNGRNFSFDPRSLKMRPESGGGQYGLSLNTRGRKFTCSNSDHLMAIMYELRYAERNPHYAMPKATDSIAVDGGAAEVYRISPEEPWRVIRTKWRVSGVVQGAIEGGGRSAGYFTGATGATVYRGSSFPPDFLDNVFTGDAGGNLMHRKKIFSDGVSLKASRPEDEKNVEFLASKDTWFRPVKFANAPDGCFYILDMYRETIEHPWSLPEPLKKHLDLNSGNDRGRIFRIVPENFKQPKLPALGKMKTSQLVTTLEHPNGWHRETASRLLYERQDKSAIPALVKTLAKSKSPLGRLHALYALDGHGALSEQHILQALGDADDRVREHAIRLSETFFSNGVPSPALWSRLKELPGDPSPHVLLQLAFTLGEIRHQERNQALAATLKRDAGNSWMQAAALSSLAEGAAEMFNHLSKDAEFAAIKGSEAFLLQLATVIGARNNPIEVDQLLSWVATGTKTNYSFALLSSLGAGLQRAGTSLSKADKHNRLKTIFEQAVKHAKDNSATESSRTQAIQLLGMSNQSEATPSLLELLGHEQPQGVQLTALTTLGKFPDTKINGEIISRWRDFSPRLRSEAITILLTRSDRATALIHAIQKGSIRRADLNDTQVKFLTNHRDPSVKALASSVLGSISTPKRQDVVDAYQSSISLKGDVAKGKALFLERCASCHKYGNEGFALGPGLETVQTTGREKLLVNILDPNREVAPQFQAYEVETRDGESYIGLMANETTANISVQQAYGKLDVIPRANILKMNSQEQSLMPEGLESGLTPQDVANLLEFIEAGAAGN